MINELRQVLPLRLLISTMFLFLMWLFFQAYQPWQPIDQDLLYGTGTFSNATDLSGWRRETGKVEWTDDTGYVELKPRARLRFSLPAFAGDLLLCSGRMKTQDLATGKKAWDAARIMVYFEDEKGRIRWSHPHNVGYLSGNNDWQQVSALIEVPAFARKGWVELAHYGTDGIAYFDDISIQPAIWKETYTHWQMFFGMVWAAIMMWLLLNTHYWTLPWGRPLLISGIMIIVFVTLPPATMFQVASSGAKLSQKVLHTAEDVFPDVTPAQSTAKQITPEVSQTQSTSQAASKTVKPTIEQKLTKQPQPETPAVAPVRSLDVQKMGHGLLFAVLGFFAFMALYRKVDTTLLVYTLVLFAASTEVLQLVIDGRLFGVTDLFLDIAGIAVGAAIAYVFCHVRSCE